MQTLKEDFNPNEQLKVAAKWTAFGLMYAITGVAYGAHYLTGALHEQLGKLTTRLDPRDPRRVTDVGEERQDPWIKEDGIGLGDSEVPQVDIGSGLIEEPDLDQPVAHHEEQSTRSEVGVTSTRKVVNLGQEVKRVIEETADQEPKTIGDLIKKQLDNH